MKIENGKLKVERWKLKLGSSSEITIPAGSSAKYSAETINAELSETGINATANTRVELWHDGAGGKVQFKIGSKSFRARRAYPKSAIA